MAVYILDTTTLTHFQAGHPLVTARFTGHAGDTVGVSAVNVEESLGGWYTKSRKARNNAEEAASSQLFAAAIGFISRFPIFPLTEPILDRYDRLRKLRLNVGRNDLKIAATALELGAVVVTNNATDFGRVPGLTWEDWTR